MEVVELMQFELEGEIMSPRDLLLKVFDNLSPLMRPDDVLASSNIETSQELCFDSNAGLNQDPNIAHGWNSLNSGTVQSTSQSLAEPLQTTLIIIRYWGFPINRRCRAAMSITAICRQDTSDRPKHTSNEVHANGNRQAGKTSCRPVAT